MKKILLFLGLGLVLSTSYAQEETKGCFNISADLVSRYVWRGVEFGNSPAIQPSLSYSLRDLTLGAWGNYSFNTNTRGTELDLFASYAFDFGLSVTITDYYFPIELTEIIGETNLETGEFFGTMTDERIGDYFDYKNDHYFELGLAQSIGNFSLSINYFFTNSMNDDLYFEAGYEFKRCSVFAGGGNKSYTDDGDFNLVNLGVNTTKKVKITDNYSLPVFGSVILNPNINQFHFVVGITI